MLRVILTVVFVVATSGQLHARTWHLEADGSGDASTIAAAIDSSSVGDVIELACGTYVEWGLILKSGVTIRSVTGDPDCTTIDGNQPVGFGSVMGCWNVDSTTLIEGLTITGGRASDPFYGSRGGGMVIFSGSDPVVRRCHITGNYAKSGGGVSISSSHPTFIDCVVSGNESQFYPGGVDVGIDASFTAFETSITSNISGSQYLDGSVRESSEVSFFCCEFNPDNWLFAGTVIVDDENCRPVGSEAQSWGSLKSLFR